MSVKMSFVYFCEYFCLCAFKCSGYQHFSRTLERLELGLSARVHFSSEINSIGDSGGRENGRVGKFSGHGGILI